MARELRTPALLASIEERGESDALVRCLTPATGALCLIARGLRKPASKLAPLLQPARELDLRSASKGGTALLTGASLTRDHLAWREDLRALALYWFMLDCALACAEAEAENAATYQLVANLLRSEQALTGLHGVAAVFALKLLALHGLLPSLSVCALDGHQLAAGEPAHLLPSGEGLIGREAYNAHYARSGGGLLRISPQQVERWRRLAHGPLLDYTQAGANLEDAAILTDLAARVIGDVANRPLTSLRFLTQQWGMPGVDELLARQRS